MFHSSRLSALTLAAALTFIFANETLAAPHNPHGSKAHSTARDTTNRALAGTFRFVLTSHRITASTGLLILEQSSAGLYGTLMLSDSRPSALGNVTVRDTLVTANLLTTDGAATLELRIVGDEVTGTIARGKTQWIISGRRTN